jgi:hypothetical protein
MVPSTQSKSHEKQKTLLFPTYTGKLVIEGLERIRTENPPPARGSRNMSFQMLGQFIGNNELNPFDKQMLSKQLYGCQSVMCNTFPPSF